jgi:2-succinyl-5-enolpyruvyl-6-hydroxy-3-cyclohexene-1-carboxylate synthase
VLTADRPHELRDVGAPQTIDQQRLYGEHAKWFFDLPEPELTLEHVRLVRVVAARAVATAAAEPAGPVHLNWPLREPLLPSTTTLREPAAWGVRPDGSPYVRISTGRLAPSSDLTARLAHDLADIGEGLIVCGPQDDPLLPASVGALAERLGYPILADPLSGVRAGSHNRSLVVDAYDAFLKDMPTVERLRPRVIVRLGALPTSKPLHQYLQRFSGARQILVDASGWRDPFGVASDVVHVDPRVLCDALLQTLGAGQSSSPDWSSQWLAVDVATRQAIERHVSGLDELFEGKVFPEVLRLVAPNTTLFVGNSMPVRDLDTFMPSSSVPLRCLSNRGANGIDGVVSSALGASAAGAGPVVLVIGDVSFYHDLNGLLAARKHGLDLLVVLVNNDGGGIFSFLSQGELPTDRFEQLFGTPHGLDFRPFVEGYGGHFTRVDDWSAFASAVSDGLSHGGLQVVEIPSQRDRNVVLHREVGRVVADALAAVPAAVG